MQVDLIRAVYSQDELERSEIFRALFCRPGFVPFRDFLWLNLRASCEANGNCACELRFAFLETREPDHFGRKHLT